MGGGSEIAKLFVSLSLQAADFTSGVRAAERDLDSLSNKAVAAGKKMAGIGKAMTIGLTAPIVAGAAFAINSASDLEEATTAATATYGDMAKQVIANSKDTDQALLVSQQQYLENATVLGVYGTAAGLTGQDLVDFGAQGLTAAQDLSSFYNIPLEDALMAWQAGLRGETEPMSRFGIQLNQAELEAYALTEGLWDGNSAMTAQQKTLVRQAYMLDHMGSAQGDAAKTAGGLANQQRILAKRFKDISAIVGKHMLPLALGLATAIGDLFTWAEKLSPSIIKIGLVIAGVVAAIGPLLMVLGYLTMAFGVLLGPIGLVVAAIALLALAWNKDFLGIASRTTEFVSDLIAVFKRLTGEGVNPVSAAIRAFGSAFEDLTGIEVSDFFYDVAEAVDVFLSSFSAFRDAGANLPTALWMALGDAIGSVVGVDVSAWFNGVATAVGDLWTAISTFDIAGALSALAELADLTVDATISVGALLWGGIKAGVGDFVTWLTRQVMGDAVVGDGTGGPMGAEIPLGTVLLKIADLIVDSAKTVGVAVYDFIHDHWGVIKDTAFAIGGAAVRLGEWTITSLETIGAAVVDFVAMAWGAFIAGSPITLGGWTIELQEPLIELLPETVQGWVQGAVDAATGITAEIKEWHAILSEPQVTREGGGEPDNAWIENILKSKGFGRGLRMSIPGANLTVEEWEVIGDVITRGNDALQRFVSAYRGWKAEVPSWMLAFPGPVPMFTFAVSWVYEKIKGYIGNINVSLPDWVLEIIDPVVSLNFSAADVVTWILEQMVGQGFGPIEVPITPSFKFNMPGGETAAGDQVGSFEAIGSVSNAILALRGAGGIGGGGGRLAGPNNILEKVQAPDFSDFLTAHDTAFAQARSKFDSIAEYATNAGQNAADGFNNLFKLDPSVSHAGAVQGSMESIFSGIAADATNKGVVAGEGFNSGITLGTNQAVSQSGATQASMVAIFSGIAASMTNLGIAGGQGFAFGVSGGMAQAVSSAFAGANQIRGALSGIGNLHGQGYAIGASLGQGIAAGIGGMVGAVAAQAANIVTTAVNAARQAGAIRSPSKVMAEMVGMPLAQGVAVGIRKGARDVERAALTLIPSGRPSAVPGLSRFEAADRRVEEHHHWTINAEFGTGEDWDRFFDTNQRQARLASVRGG